ncbi:nitrate reductase molybdenum cofactor assembly chaperone [Nonomuraea typhae]|uniref:nitrate reductase molybdenum cofactor assembly chaperone n=1 Tax=Nonomuraea typhae TaxID=2603600 RepID=UPI0012F9983D|nr:nitrate reductase molybdenum cofactor assembly chaperone [Nonomuraea typhae]
MIVHQAASLLLCYPGDDWPGRRALVEDALREVRGEAAALLRAFCATAIAPLDLARTYVATFDRSNRRTLHMTYYTDGDTRRRGMSLARLKALYRAHGWLPDTAELPDFLPLMLEFAARCPGPGTDLLHAHRPGIDVLSANLSGYGGPYAGVLQAVAASLGDPTPAQRRLARAITTGGPPAETVGIEALGAYR